MENHKKKVSHHRIDYVALNKQTIVIYDISYVSFWKVTIVHN